MEVKSCLEMILNCPLKKADNQDWEIYSTVLLGLNIALHDNADYDDDETIQFSKYDYQITFDYIRSAFTGYYADEWKRMASIIIADMLFKNLQCECIVLRNLNTFLAKFTPDEEIFMSYEENEI